MHRNYNIIVNAGNGIVSNAFISCESDLLETYKRAIIQNEGFIVWDKGVININQIVGIIDQTYYPSEDN